MGSFDSHSTNHFQTSHKSQSDLISPVDVRSYIDPTVPKKLSSPRRASQFARLMVHKLQSRPSRRLSHRRFPKIDGVGKGMAENKPPSSWQFSSFITLHGNRLSCTLQIRFPRPVVQPYGSVSLDPSCCHPFPDQARASQNALPLQTERKK
jgi:hypothetical protein